MFWKNNGWWIVILLIIAAVVSTWVSCSRNWTEVHEDQVTVLDTVRKTYGAETRTVEYYLYTDKGYFKVGGPVNAEGTPYAWKLANDLRGKTVTVKYYGAGWYRIDAWMWYPYVYEIHLK